MTSTEQKNVTQPFIDSCFSFGIYATVAASYCDAFELCTSEKPFDSLDITPNMGERFRAAKDPAADVRRLLPVTDAAPFFTKHSPFILKLVSRSAVYTGNSSVLRLAEGILSNRWGIHFGSTPALRHARNHTAKIIGMLAPGAYGQSHRGYSNAVRFGRYTRANVLRAAAEVFDYLSKSHRHGRDLTRLRHWCTSATDSFEFRTNYRRKEDAFTDYKNINSDLIDSLPDPPPIRQKLITAGKQSIYSTQLYCVAGHYYLKISTRFHEEPKSRIRTEAKAPSQTSKLGRRRNLNEVYVLSKRDMTDLVFLIQAGTSVLRYHRRRLTDVRDRGLRISVRTAQDNMWSTYIEVMRLCGRNYHLRNKLGVYFDVLQWRYLAWKSGDVFYNHSVIMRNKIKSKGLIDLPDQDMLLNCLKKLPMDIAVDLLGMYKASIYPEVDPFRVVVEQYNLHYSRHQTEWERGSEEYERFQNTRSYMWYLGIRVLRARYGSWPGKIREGATAKGWHKEYKTRGLPGSCWRDACDVDLTSTVRVTPITNEQYMRQQDSACAPPLAREYKDYESMKRAPRKHRRKLLYAIQENDLVDLPETMRALDQLGRGLPTGYVDEIKHELPFSVDIVTGSRCERHKDAPRPFYAASPPWGCVLSYYDGITRDFLHHVPQSMLGKSTRQKYEDLQHTSRSTGVSTYTFYMSDDKAKYSPRMDPNSQQLPAEFFAEVFNTPGLKAVGPIMFHNLLYYRVNGHLVSYSSNGTDREGMRGASNTWLEIVAQGLSTRLCREKNLIVGKSIFLSFIDDGLRKFSVQTRLRSDYEIDSAARSVIDDVIFGLRVLGRELSWDKTFISRDLFVILNELVYDGTFISSGLKSFCTMGDLEMKEVMTAPDYEQLFFGKMRGAHGVGTPLDLCHYTYIFETLVSHYRMGVDLQDNKEATSFDYRMFCITPVALGGAGLRSQIQMSCNEVATATKEGLGNIMRLTGEHEMLAGAVLSIVSQPLEPLDPVDFMREPEQFHVKNPRLKTQRLAAEVRRKLNSLAQNHVSRRYVEQDKAGMIVLRGIGSAMMSAESVSAEEVRLVYASNPVAFIDEFVQKLATSSTLSEMLDRETIAAIRRQSRQDLVKSVNYFHVRCASREMMDVVSRSPDLVARMNDIIN